MRIMLDHNIWSDLGTEAGAGAGLAELVQQRGWVLVKQPASLLEATGDGDDERSCEVIQVFGRARGEDLLPEGFLESEELARAFAGWGASFLRPSPDEVAIAEFRLCWARRLRDAANNPRAFREWSRGLVRPVTNLQGAAYKEVQAANRENQALRFLTAKGHLDNHVRVENLPQRYRHRCEGDRVSLWRVELGQYLLFQLIEQPVDDALYGYARFWFDLSMLRDHDVQQAMLRLVVHDLAPQGVSRWLTRHLIGQLQLRHSGRKSSGDAGDNQHACHLVDADVFFTADGNFCSEVEDARQVLPFVIARPLLVAGAGAPIVWRLREAADRSGL